MAPLNKRLVLHDRADVGNQQPHAQCHVQDPDNADEGQLVDYFPRGHCMNYLLPHMFGVLDMEALIEYVPDKHITYRQLLHNAVKLAAWLVEHIDRAPLEAAHEPFFVQLYGDNSIAAVTSMYAGWLAGASLATASPMWTRERFQVYCERVNAAVLVIDARIFATMDASNVEVIKHLSLLQRVIVVNDDGSAHKLQFGNKAASFNKIVNDERTFGEALHYLTERRNSIFDTAKYGDYKEHIAFLAPSSGTTGVPKSIVLTHSVVMARVEIQRQLEESQAEPNAPEIDEVPFSLYCGTLSSVGVFAFEHMWTYAALKPKRPTGIIIPLACFDPCTYARVVEQYRIKSVITLVPQMLRVFFNENIKTKYDLSSVTSCLTGAWPLKPKLQRLVAKMQNWNNGELGQGYGATEVGFLLTSNQLTPEEKLEKVGSIGRLSPFYPLELKMVDLETNKLITTPHTRGELLARTIPGSTLNPVFQGYYKNDEKTREVLSGDGWYRTGDIVYFDQDGAYWHVERIAELVWLDDNNWCAPAELEESLLVGLEREVADVALVAQTKTTKTAKGRHVLDHMIVFVEPRKFCVPDDDTVTNRKWATSLSEQELKEKICRVFNDSVRDKRLQLTCECVYLCCRLPRNNSKIMRSYLRELLSKPDELNRCLQQVATMAGAASKAAVEKSVIV